MAVGEGEVDTSVKDAGVEYSGVDTCFTVTCLLEDGSYVGGHIALMVPGGKLDSSQVLGDMKGRFGGQKVTKVHIAGALENWNPAYLRDPFFIGDDFNTAKYPEPPSQGDVTDEVRSQLGLDGGTAFTTEQKKGPFTVKLD